MTKTVAIFDLDKTLVPFDCDEQWGLYLHKKGLTSDDFLNRQRVFFEQYDAGTLDIHAYQAFAIEPVVKMGMRLATEHLNMFLREVITPNLNEQVKQLIRSHRDQDHILLVITATNCFVSTPVAHLLGLENVIAIDLELDESDCFNGKIAGTPSFREGKVQRFKDWLRQRNLCLSEIKTYFYSDSINDLPLLEFVDVPIATNPCSELRKIAGLNMWQTIDFF